jgi:adenylate kinase family enzyme
MNILIVGPPGSGKSTLASQLGKRYHLNHIELDSLKHGKNWQPASKDELKQAVRKEIIKDDWVVDGNYISTFGDELINKADVVIWLDYSFPFVFQRLLRRTLKRTLIREELWNGNRESFYNNFFTKNSVLRHMMQVWKRQRDFYLSIFNEVDTRKVKKMIRVRHPRELEKAIKF